MTGFGRGSAGRGGIDATVEIRSVNGRYAEVSVRSPKSLNEYEQEIQTIVRKRVERGRINVQIEIDRQATGDELHLSVDPVAARAYGSLLRQLAEEAGVAGEVRLEHVLQFSDVFTTQQQDDDIPRQHWQAVLPALEEAVTALVTMRRQEGETLAVELHNRLDHIETELGEIESAAPLRVTAARERLHQRLADVLGDERIDRDRLEQEIVMIADRLDMTEECVRLHSHLTQFREALSADDAIGRRLNFISQEMNREVNTIGSKANDAEIARRVVVMKEELEKIREQIQNIE